MNPEALAAALLAVVAPLAEARREGSTDGSDRGRPAARPAEEPRPRRLGLQRRAQARARRVGANPRELAAEIAAGLDAVAGHRERRGRRTRLHQHPPGCRGRRRAREDDRRGRRGVRHERARSAATRSTSSSSARTRPARSTSAAPAGPRVGDSLARILAVAGRHRSRASSTSTTHGAQIDRFARSLRRRAPGRADARGRLRRRLHPRASRAACALAYGGDLAATCRRRRAAGGVPRDRRRLHVRRDQGEPARVRRRLRRVLPRERRCTSPVRGRARGRRGCASSGHIFEDDGAIWLRTTDFGDDKDRVIRRVERRVTPTLAATLAYYLNKRERGFDAQASILLGADHHGYVHRLMAIAGAFGDEPGREPRDPHRAARQPVRTAAAAHVQARGQHHRAGRPREMARHRCRCATRSRASPADSPLDARPRAAAEAHERQPGVLRAVRARPHPQRRHATPRHPASTARSSRPSCSTHETESALLGALQEFPRIVAFAAEVREPHRVARYLEELAGLYHRWYDNCRVIPLGDEPVEAVHRTRLLAQRRHRSGAAQRPRPARRRRAGTDVGPMSAGDTQPTQPLPANGRTPSPRPRRAAGRWPWIVALVIVVVPRGRGVVRRRGDRARPRDQDDPRRRSSPSSSLPADQDVDVDVPGRGASRS